MTKLHIDFETRSRVNLLRAGPYNYAMDASTQVLCMAYAFDDGPVNMWIPEKSFPDAVRAHIASGGIIVAHNAQFERLIFWYVLCPDMGLPEPTVEQFHCSAAQARTNGLPGALADGPRALGLDVRKDPRGAELIQLLSVPSGATKGDKRAYFDDGEFSIDLGLFLEMVTYCKRDVETERELTYYMRELTETEWEEYWASEYANDRGVQVDVELCRAAVEYADDEVVEINKRLHALIGVAKARSPKVTLWVYDHLPEALQEVMVKEDGKLSLDKAIVETLLALEDVPLVTRQVLELRALISASSVAKFRTMLERADPEDGRVRGSFLFAGAPTSGRYSARGLQLHNYPRDCADNPETVREAILKRRVPDGKVMATLSSMLRPSLVGDLVWGDWSAIEARALPWLTGDVRGDAVLDVFRECDADPSADDVYVRAASEFGGSRQEGKVAVLSLGYGGSVGAFQAMSRGYGVQLEDGQVKSIVSAWRRSNPWAESFWNDLESTAVRAIRHPGEWFTVGRVGYAFSEDQMGGTLYCCLPSGRLLCYPKARVDIVDTQYGATAQITALKASRKPAAGAPEWPRFRLWRGLLAENITQAACADLLRDALVVCEQEGLPVIGHVHDEIILESKDMIAQAELKSIMESGPDWAEGLPLAAETKCGNRYSK